MIDTSEFELSGAKFELPATTKVKVLDTEGNLKAEYQNRVRVDGRFGAHPLHVKTTDSGKKLFIEGSLAGAVFGQQVFTPKLLSPLIRSAVKLVFEKLGLPLDAKVKETLREGDVDLYRVDVARNYLLDSQANVLETLAQMRRQLSERGWALRIEGAGTTLIWTPDRG